MAEPFLSEIRMYSFAFAPKGWAQCNGQFLPINQNQALFSLLGTTYGGDGRTNFALPDFRGRVPIHEGAGFTLGQKAGEQTHTLSLAEMPTHNHLVTVNSGNADQAIPAARFFGASPNTPYHAATGNLTSLPTAINPVGGSQAHENMQPYLTISFCIALQGIFPSPN
jgi:microcystin-dependent protein